MPDEQNDNKPQINITAVTDMMTRRSPDFRSIYANNTKFGASAFEFSFILGEITESAEGKLYVDQKVRILMSPLHAKIFVMVLAQNIENFEARFGNINVPEGAIPTQTSPPVFETREPSETP